MTDEQVQWWVDVDPRTGGIIVGRRRQIRVRGARRLLNVLILSVLWPVLLLVAGEASTRYGDAETAAVVLGGFLLGTMGLVYGILTGWAPFGCYVFSVLGAWVGQLLAIGMMDGCSNADNEEA